MSMKAVRALVTGASVSVLALAGFAESETVIEVPAGTYTLNEILTASGTSTNPIRYRPQTPGTVAIRGGLISGMHDIILDGFFVNGRLDTDWPKKSRGLDIRDSTNITVMNTEIAGPADIHTGYDIFDRQSCDEADGYPTQSSGIGSLNTENITFSNIVVHGFRGAGALRGNHDRVLKSLFRNNFNGFGISSVVIDIIDNVFWVHPNHLFTLEGAGIVNLTNNLLVDAQDMFQAGVTWDGVQQGTIVKNTFYIPENKPCYGFTGPNFYRVKQSVRFRDNILVNKRDGWMTVSNASLLLLSSNYNLMYNYQQTTEEYNLLDRRRKVLYEEWVTLTGQDRNSKPRQRPVFADAPQYGDFAANQWGFRIPGSVAEAKSWFALKPDSPGKGVASDGGDIGMNSTTTPDPPSTPDGVNIVR
jgi:hypothetical protein